MRSVNSSEVLLPEVETFSPIGAEVAPRPSLPPVLSPLQVAPQAQAASMAATAQPSMEPRVQAEPQIVPPRLPVAIGKGGFTLAVPGAENMVAPFEPSAVSMLWRLGPIRAIHQTAMG